MTETSMLEAPQLFASEEFDTAHQGLDSIVIDEGELT
jgi:hypothetical protein